MMVLVHLSMKLMVIYRGSLSWDTPTKTISICKDNKSWLDDSSSSTVGWIFTNARVYAFKCPLPLPYVNYKINDFPLNSLQETSNQSNCSVNQNLVDCIHLYTVLGIHQFSTLSKGPFSWLLCRQPAKLAVGADESPSLSWK